MRLTDTEILGCYFYTLYRDKCYMKNLDMFIAGMQYTLFSNIFSNPFKVGTDTLEPEAEVLFGIVEITDSPNSFFWKDEGDGYCVIIGYQILSFVNPVLEK